MADPGFPRCGGANSKGGCKKLLFSHFVPKKLHKIERIWTPREGRVPGPPLLGPPMEKVLHCDPAITWALYVVERRKENRDPIHEMTLFPSEWQKLNPKF